MCASGGLDRHILCLYDAEGACNKELAMIRKTLVIGYGNTLRGDDGIGPAVAQGVKDKVSGDVIIRHQLTPELAEPIAAADLVVFVDAAPNVRPGAVAVREIYGTTPPSPGLAHAASPAALLQLADTLYGGSPRAFIVTIGAGSFALSEFLSDGAAAALPEAIATVTRLLSGED
jgi:hydrogenase maturation protease